MQEWFTSPTAARNHFGARKRTFFLWNRYYADVVDMWNFRTLAFTDEGTLQHTGSSTGTDAEAVVHEEADEEADVIGHGRATAAASTTAHAEAHAEVATEGVSESSFLVATPPKPTSDEVRSACLRSSCRTSLHASLAAAKHVLTLAFTAAAA